MTERGKSESRSLRVEAVEISVIGRSYVTVESDS